MCIATIRGVVVGIFAFYFALLGVGTDGATPS